MTMQSSTGDSVDLSLVFGTDQSSLASEISVLWDTWQSQKSDAMSRWDEILRYVSATSTKDTTNETVTDWSNTTHRPKLANIYDTLTINYDFANFPNGEWLKWFGGDEESAYGMKAKIIESYMHTKHNIRASGFRETARQWESDWATFGNCFATVDYIRETVEDPITRTVSSAYVGPKVGRLDPRDVAMNPMASSFRSTPKIVRSMFTMGDLYRTVSERPDQTHFADILDIAKKNRGAARRFDTSDIDKSSNLQFDGFGSASSYFNSGLIEVLEFYGDLYDWNNDVFRKNHVITVVDRWNVIRDEPIKTWSGRPHIYHCGWRPRTGNLWAQGPLDNLVGMQYRMNHLENARADAFDQMIDPDMVFIGDPEQVTAIGGAKHYYMPEGGQVNTLRPDTTVLAADLQIKELEMTMEMYALAPREALGIRSPGEKTAFEVGELNNAAGRAFQHKVNIFQEFLEDVVNAELEVAVQNLDTTDVIQVTDDDLGAVQFQTITKADIMATGRLVPMGARHFARSNQIAKNLAQLQQGPLQDPEVAQHFSSIALAEMYQNLLDTGEDKNPLVRPYVRIEERLESQRRAQVAEDQAALESQISGVPLDNGTGSSNQAS